MIGGDCGGLCGMGDQRGLIKKSNYFGGLGGLVGQDGQGDGGGHMVRT